MKGLSRIGGEEAVWHVMNRAAHRVQIFTTDGHYSQFVSLLRTFTRREGLEVAAYAVMPNHYHVLVKGAGDRLTRCFHEVDRLWAVSWNEFREQTGHVFQGPFLSFVQHTPGWIVRTSAYIHLNPVPRPARRPEEYAWSSYGVYAERAPAPSWVHPEIVLRCFEENDAAARKSYRALVEARLEWKATAPQGPEERVVHWALARELAALVSRVEVALKVSNEEAKRLVAYYGRGNLLMPVKVLAGALGYRNAAMLSNAIHRMRVRLQKEPGYRTLAARADELLGRL